LGHLIRPPAQVHRLHQIAATQLGGVKSIAIAVQRSRRGGAEQ
jgi:hypothetical protein